MPCFDIIIKTLPHLSFCFFTSHFNRFVFNLSFPPRITWIWPWFSSHQKFSTSFHLYIPSQHCFCHLWRCVLENLIEGRIWSKWLSHVFFSSCILLLEFLRPFLVVQVDSLLIIKPQVHDTSLPMTLSSIHIASFMLFPLCLFLLACLYPKFLS